MLLHDGPRHGVALALAGAAALTLSGCYGRQLANLEVRTARIEDAVTKLQRSHGELAATVEQMNRLLQEEVQLARSGRAASEERLRETQRLLQVLATKLEESSTLTKELREETHAGKPAGGDTSMAGAAPTARALYDAAYQDLVRGNHGLAIMGFQEVIAKFSRSELADNAQYWIGEAYYAQKDYKQALGEFQKVAENFPQGDKLPAALLKMGFCQLQLGDKTAARATFNKLIQDHPDSEEARLAGGKLKEM